MTKVEFNPKYKTQAENTIKLVRIVRCKNENLHAALKQKYQILDSVIELSYLEPLFHSDSSPSKYTAIAAVCGALYNLEHPGFPLVFLEEHQKIPQAEQILNNFMTENFLQHMEFSKGWREVKYHDFHEQFTFPYIDDLSKVSQIFEVTSSIHALLKGQQVSSHLRRFEVDKLIDSGDLNDFKTLMMLPPEEITVKYKRLDEAPAPYQELAEDDVLQPWPGPGTLFQVTCAPSNKSDQVKRNWKAPTVFILDGSSINPLNFTDIFKTVGCFYCYNCPSINGSLAGCCHVGFLFMLLSAPYLLQDSTNKPVRVVNMKNKHGFLHPPEVMAAVKSSLPFDSTMNSRNSKNKRDSSILYNPSSRITFSNSGSDLSERMNEQTQHSSMLGTDQILDSTTNRSEYSHELTTQDQVHPVLSILMQEQDNLNLHVNTPSLVSNTVSDQTSKTTSHATSTQTSVTSMFGYGTADIDRYLKRITKRNPHLSIPSSKEILGKIFFSFYTNT